MSPQREGEKREERGERREERGEWKRDRVSHTAERQEDNQGAQAGRGGMGAGVHLDKLEPRVGERARARGAGEWEGER